MGNPNEVNDPSSTNPPSSPMLDRSTTYSFNEGRCYNKSWIAMGLTFFLVIVLLIALIIVASTNSTPPRTELDCENDDRLTGYQDPHSSESKHEGAPDHHPDIVVMLDTTTKPTTTKPTVKDEDGLDWINDWDEWDEDDEYSKNDGHVKSSTVTTTISTKTLIETTEQSVIETFDDIGNGLFARTVKPLRTEVEFQTTQDSIQFQTTGKFTMQEDSVTDSTNFEDKETFDFKPFETEGEKEVQKTTVSAEIHNAIHETTQIETKKEEKFTTIASGIYNTIQETTQAEDEKEVKLDSAEEIHDSIPETIHEPTTMHEEDPQIDGMAKLLRLVSQDQNKTVLANHIKQNYAGNTTLVKEYLEVIQKQKETFNQNHQLSNAIKPDNNVPDSRIIQDDPVYAAQTISTEDRNKTANVMEKFLFSKPVTNDATSEIDDETKVADFYENVKILGTALDEMVHEEKMVNMEKDLDFVMDLSKGLKPPNASGVDLKLPNTTILDKVHRLYYEFVSSSDSLFQFARIKEEINELGLEDLEQNVSEDQINQMKVESIQESYVEYREEVAKSRDVDSQVKCNRDTELSCLDGSQCYPINKRCDRWSDCLSDRSDEMNCSCRNYLEPHRICDGYPDCPEGEDETGCFCANKHNCGFDLPDGTRAGFAHCIDQHLRCDNIQDCSNDENNCYALSPAGTFLDGLPTQELQGWLHIQRSGIWYPLAFDTDIIESQRDEYNELFEGLASEVCQSTVTKGFQRPKYTLVQAKDYVYNVAHLIAALNPGRLTGSRFFEIAGRFRFNLGPVFGSSTKFLQVKCGEPKCGFAINDGNDPFAVFNQGFNYKRPSSTLEATLRIVGGIDSRPTKWPFALSVHKNGKFKCGASIIDKDWILTAAHCVQKFSEQNALFEVYGGMYRQKSLAMSQTVRKLTQIYIHPEYIADTFDNDIALAKVDQSFPMNSFTSQICLPEVVSKDTVTLPNTEDTCMAVGWGKLRQSIGPVADTLQEVEVPILENCKNNEIQICGGFDEGGKDACEGDSGGPLFCRFPTTRERWYLAGIVSHGIGCAQPKQPGIYTRVAYYQDWIRQTIKSSIDSRHYKKHQTNMECPSNVYCDYGKCVQKSHLCNLYSDCFDGADEKHCKVVNKYDGIPDLVYDPTINPDVEPVQYETKIEAKPHRNGSAIYKMPVEYKECKSGDFVCKNVHECIPGNFRCNMVEDCIDGSDEQDCSCKDYFEVFDSTRICDGYPDCYDFSDELGCLPCSNATDEPQFYCQLSNTCIPKHQVCDEKYDCKFQEDERYCVALTNNDYVITDVHGKPKFDHNGYVAINAKGRWRMICARKWNDRLSKKICQYLGFRPDNKEPYKQIGTSKYQHLLSSHMKTKGYNHFIAKRQTTNQCTFIENSCSNIKECGTLPLYSSLGPETPIFGEGTSPWLAKIYVEGEHVCDATLISSRWLVTHTDCDISIKSLEDMPEKYSVARLGSYLNLDKPKFLAGHEQVVRISRSMAIPMSQIALMKLEKPVKLTEYVNTICLPSSEWIPIGTKCQIHGTHNEEFNHAIITRMTSKCNHTGDDNFYLCTEQELPSGECLSNWSGSLVCPDLSGKFYAIGIYHVGQNDCSNATFSNIPTKFIPLINDASREAIKSIISANSGSEEPLDDLECDSNENQHRCPLGKCLDKKQICDGAPDCQDASDEKSDVCQKHIEMCEAVNATHCQCLLDDMMCGNLKCLHSSKFCDGHDDCGDGSDEPPNCEHDCSLALEAFNQSLICNGKIDCINSHDMANDESVEKCCTSNDTVNNYRCVLGDDPFKPDAMEVSDECIPRKCVCDWDSDPDNCQSCTNGADEVDCVSIFGHRKHNYDDYYSNVPNYGYSTNNTLPQNPTLDAFGRATSQREGYLYFTAHGRQFLYCASTKIFTPERLPLMGQALCKNEHFGDLIDIFLIPPKARTKINPSLILSPEEKEEFDNCQIVYLHCRP